MKKGDVIEKRRSLDIGSILIRNCTDEAHAENIMLEIEKHYNFRTIPKMEIKRFGLQPQADGLCVVLSEPSYVTIQAKINWIIDNETSIEYLDTGGMEILDMSLPENQGWVVIHEASPEYQTSVEHMTDEQLRASIEELRARRQSRPESRAKATRLTIKSAPTSAEDKALASLLSSKSPEEMLELKRKLGLCD